jgi:hypothetical protein
MDRKKKKSGDGTMRCNEKTENVQEKLIVWRVNEWVI